MAITTYAELQSAVRNWLHRAALSGEGGSDITGDLITLGEVRLFRDLRVRQQEVALSGTISGGVLAVPSDYIELKFVYIDGTPVQILERKSLDYVYGTYPIRSSEGKPKVIARQGGNFVFGPYPDSDYSVIGVYYGRPTPLSSAVNSVFLANPDVYLFAALSEARAFTSSKQDIILTWEKKYLYAVAQANGTDRGEEASGSIPRMVAR